MQIFFRTACVILVFFTFSSLNADDAEARRAFEDALEEEKAGNYKNALDSYLAAELYADDTVLKRNALEKAAENARKSGKLFREFTCLQKLVRNHPADSNFIALILRQKTIGDAFYKSHRDAIYSWFPDLKDKDHTIEIYETVLKNAPLADFAPETRLRLAKRYLDEGKIEDAVKAYRENIRLNDNTETAKFARFELANILIQLAEKGGDGDGSYNRQALEVLNEIVEKYPDSPDVKWAKRKKILAGDVAANRLYGLARFYNRAENEAATERYLKELAADYPDSQAAEKGRLLLAELDPEYKSPEKPEKVRDRHERYNSYQLPESPEKILVVPENSSGKWLLPVEDLDIPERPGLEKIEKRQKEK